MRDEGSSAPTALPDRITYRTSPRVMGGSLGAMACFTVLVTASTFEVANGLSNAKLPTAMVLLMIGAFVTWRRSAVVVTPTHLIVASTIRTTSLPWRDIVSLYETAGYLSVTSTQATVDISRNLVRVSSADAPHVVVDGVRQAWTERRGEQWTVRPIDGWQPTLDVRERVVLRRPLTSNTTILGYISTAILVGAIEGLMPSQPLSRALVPVAMFCVVLGAIILLDAYRTALVVTPHEVVLRSLTRSRRFRRSDVLGAVPEESAPMFTRQGPPVRRVVLQTTSGQALSQAPGSGYGPSATDPLFFRKLVWLDAELRSGSTWTEPSGALNG